MSIVRKSSLAVVQALVFACSPSAPGPGPVASTPSPPVAGAQAGVLPQPPVTSVAYSAGETHERSKSCSYPFFRFRSGGVAEMHLQNDGNWCWIPLRSRTTGGAFSNVTIIDAPNHGTFESAPVDSRSRLYYKPAPGFTGEDSFKIRLEPGDNSLTINVTVS